MKIRLVFGKNTWTTDSSMENVCIEPSPSSSKVGTGTTCVTQGNCISLLQGKIQGPRPVDPISNFQDCCHHVVLSRCLLSPLQGPLGDNPSSLPKTLPHTDMEQGNASGVHRPTMGRSQQQASPGQAQHQHFAGVSGQRWRAAPRSPPCLLRCTNVSPLISPFSISGFTRSGPVLSNKYKCCRCGVWNL